MPTHGSFKSRLSICLNTFIKVDTLLKLLIWCSMEKSNQVEYETLHSFLIIEAIVSFSIPTKLIKFKLEKKKKCFVIQSICVRKQLVDLLC